MKNGLEQNVDICEHIENESSVVCEVNFKRNVSFSSLQETQYICI